ncbi:hypothetical protein [Dactylosporangium aurantiacum]|nr:hypothetical protein [Dactylosporangium aurantiacum]MDG6107771.1 hypothetical protein [Dactylosporangium aurantiacum]
MARRAGGAVWCSVMGMLFSGHRWVGLLGIGWFVLFLLGAAVLQGEPPAAGAPVAQVRDFFHTAGSRYLVGDLVAGCAFMLLLLPFGTLLPRALSTVERQPPWWSPLTAVSVVAVVTVGGTATSFLDAAALAAGGPQLDDSTVTALLYANTAGIALIGLPAAVFAASAAALVHHATGPRALTLLGGLAAVLLVAGAAFPVTGTGHGPLWTVRFVSFLALALFVLGTSLYVLTGVGRGRSRPAADRS